MTDTSNNWPQMKLQPIGYVESDIKQPLLLAGKSGLALQERMSKIREYNQTVENTICKLIIYPQWEELLDGIENFSHILVLYWPHLIDPKRRNLKKVHPMGRKDLPVQGIFATCSPARPNPVLVSAVPLLSRNQNVLEIKSLEAVNESPLIDIKPYVKPYYGAENSRIPFWMKQIHQELGIDIV
jgi:tRNA-Thr(GGU) m(6)t(6)A37 methyltransferase TsaA